MSAEIIPPFNNQQSGSVTSLPNATIYSTSNAPSSSSDINTGFNVASLVNPNTVNTLKSLKDNPKAFGDQLKDQAKQKITSAITGTLTSLLKEKEELIKAGILIEIQHQKTLLKLEYAHTPKKQYVNGEVKDIPSELDDEEYSKALIIENGGVTNGGEIIEGNYPTAKRLNAEAKKKNQEEINKFVKDPYLKIKETTKKRKEARIKAKSRTKDEKRKSRKERAKAILKNSKKTLVPIVTLLITNKIAEIIAQNDKIKKLVNDTNAIITDANNSGNPAKLSNAKLARDNAIKIINDNEAKIKKIADQIKRISTYINIFSIIVTIISSIPIPTSVPPGIGIPVNLIIKFVKILDKANRILLALSALIPILLSILDKAIAILEDLKSQLLQINGILDVASVSNFPSTSNLLTSNTTPDLTGTYPIEYRGFKFAIKEESGPKALVVRGYKRHYAVAIDENNVEVLKSDLSFTLDPNDLIDTLKVIIDQNNLFAGGSDPAYLNSPYNKPGELNSDNIAALIQQTQRQQTNQQKAQEQLYQQQLQVSATQAAIQVIQSGSVHPPLTQQQKDYYTKVSKYSAQYYERKNALDILKRNYV